MLRTCLFLLVVLMPLTTPVQAEELKSFRITGLERGRDHHIKDVSIAFTVDAKTSLVSSSSAGITLCDEPGRGDRYQPTIRYRMNFTAYSDAYRCVSYFTDYKRTFTVTISSALSRDGANYHFQGKVVVLEKGESDPEEIHVEDAIISADGPCKLLKYERANSKPNLAKTFESQREPETIVTTPDSKCEWN